MKDESLLLGIDGGGTATTAVIGLADPAGPPQILGRGQSGPSNPHAAGWPAALSNLASAVADAKESAAVTGTLRAACLTIAGCGRAAEKRRVLDWSTQVKLADQVSLLHDGEAVLAAGTPENCGLGLIAGTGSFAWGRTAAGLTARAGGWGFLLGDEGSGFQIGLAGLKAVVRAADGCGPTTSLTSVLLSECGLDDVPELVEWVYRVPVDRPSIAALAPKVIDHWLDGDAVAKRIITHAATGLAQTLMSLRHQLFPADTPRVALAGGLLTRCARYRNRVLADAAIPETRTTVVAEPETGALLIAEQLAQGHR